MAGLSTSLWFCVKGYSRLQTVVALSSAEAELFAIAEVAKEIVGLGQLASHIWGELTKPLAIYTDSASARQIAGMEGFLRRMRHVDIRLCFIQVDSTVLLQQGEVSPSPGAAPAPAAAEGEGAQRSAPRRTRRAAKMLCRAGLRCACHFVLRKDCPDRPSQP